MRGWPLLLLVPTVVGVACAAAQSNSDSDAATTSGDGGMGGGATVSSTSTVQPDGGEGGDLNLDGGATGAGGFDPDAGCATATEPAVVEKLPVDIIWVIDTSSSMASATAEVQAGLNGFASLIEGKGLDYRVVVLALRGKAPIQVGGGTRYPVCIPQPLSADDLCSDGPKFLQSAVDIYSTQPLEQILGTLGQTKGYQPGDAKGGEPWAQFLRANATKTFVIVTDDNSRLSVTDFETFAGGTNPFNSLTLPPGILDPSWNGLFTNYLFDGIYGWGSDVDPSVQCVFPDLTKPASSGATYTTLVNKTGGVRAKLCDGQAAWAPFFDAVAEAVSSTAKLACELTIPLPASGVIDYAKVNVAYAGNGTSETVYHVEDAASCAPDGWYYDDPTTPTKVILCPASCDAAQVVFEGDPTAEVQVIFGCESIVK